MIVRLDDRVRGWGWVLAVALICGWQSGQSSAAAPAGSGDFAIGLEYQANPRLEGQSERITAIYPAAALDLRAYLLVKQGDIACEDPLDCLGTFDFAFKLPDARSISYPAGAGMAGTRFSFAVLAQGSNTDLLVSSVGKIDFQGGDPSLRFFYVDGKNGDDALGNGSKTNPWRHLQHVIDVEVQSKRSDGGTINPNGRVPAGATIFLVGKDQDRVISIDGYYNTTPITIRSYRHREALLESLDISGGKNWKIAGLSFQNSRGGYNQTAMVFIDGATDVVIESNFLTSGAFASLSEWNAGVVTGVKYCCGAARVTVQHNIMRNVYVGVGQSGTHCLVYNNEITNFAGDGLINGGSFNSYVNNTILNSYNLPNDDWHRDGFQSHMGTAPDTSEGIVLAGNAIINRYPASQDPASYSPCQGYTAFDEQTFKKNWLVYNNICKTDHSWGFGLLNLQDSFVSNNVVVGGSAWNLPPGSSGWPDESWLKVTGNNNVVFNNLATSFPGENDHHNMVVDGSNRDRIFIDWKRWNYHHRPDSTAIDQGVRDDRSPGSLRDHDDLSRDTKPDLGAFEFIR